MMKYKHNVLGQERNKQKLYIFSHFARHRLCFTGRYVTAARRISY